MISSEFPGLTSVKTDSNRFPFVDCLIELAKKVRAILGTEVKIIYAADWSEYHHTTGGWYNLDPLWASPYIDIIGINSYFPLTSSEAGAKITKKDIELGWKNGEGYDYFLRNNQRVKLPPEYAWKNIEFWWKNTHINPDNKQTKWNPRSKKVWFTEIGFASIDKTTNEPNVFYDPESSIGGIPKYSNGEICYLSQKQALEVTLDTWKDSEMVEEIFVWCWDARPYPFWPQLSNIWSDGYKWSRGHWLNGKLSLTTLADILVYICYDSGIDLSKIDVSLLDGIIVDGFVIDHMSPNKEYIEHISTIYNVECIESEGKIIFTPRNSKRNIEYIPPNDFLSDEHGDVIEVNYNESNAIPKSIECLYFDKEKMYQQNISRINNDNLDHNNKLVINSNLVSTSRSISRILDNINASYLEGKHSFKFYLPPFYAYLEPGDVVEIAYNRKPLIVKITSIINSTQATLEISAISYNVHPIERQTSSYGENINTDNHVFDTAPEYIVEVLDIPIFKDIGVLSPIIYIAVSTKSGKFKPVQIECTDNQYSNKYQYSEYIAQEAVMGVADCIDLSTSITPEIIDYNSTIRVALTSGVLTSISYKSMLTGHDTNLAVIENELIQFMIAKQIGDNEYLLSGLKRGCLGT